MLLETATSFKAGTVPVKACYVGDRQIWPGTRWTPATLPGLAVWFDAADYTPGSWRNRGAGAAPQFMGAPAPAWGSMLNGRPVVRFNRNEGRIRMLSGSGVYAEWTLVYVGRMVGPFAGRIVTAVYTPANLLVGFWNGFQDVMYDAGFTVPNPQTQWTTDWKMYSGDGSGTISRLFSGGIHLGSVETAEGWKDTFSISGYDPTVRTDEETCDCEVAEVVLYNRKLTDADRQQVEAYLHDKWFGSPFDPATNAYLAATGLDSSYAPALDGLVRGLKDTGLWAKMAAIYPFIGGTAALHKWNLKDPRDADDAYRLGFWDRGTTSHSDALGYRANAQGQGRGGGYADTYLVPAARLADVNSTHLAFYGLEDTPAEDRAEMGNFSWLTGPERFHIISRYANVNAFYYGQSEQGASNVGVPAASGLFVATRTSATNQSAYRNGVLLASDASAPSAGLPPFSVLVGAISGFANATDIPCGFASIGAGLAAQDVADLNRVVTDYQTALNRRPVQTGFW